MQVRLPCHHPAIPSFIIRRATHRKLRASAEVLSLDLSYAWQPCKPCCPTMPYHQRTILLLYHSQGNPWTAAHNKQSFASGYVIFNRSNWCRVPEAELVLLVSQG